MRDLLRTQHDSGRNAPRNFWNWVRRQPWRRMLPEPIECPGHHLGGIFVYPVTCTDQSCMHSKNMTDLSNSKGANSVGGQDTGGKIPYGIVAYVLAFGGVLWLLYFMALYLNLLVPPTSMLGLPQSTTMISGCFENVSLGHLEFLDYDICAMYKQLLMHHTGP